MSIERDFLKVGDVIEVCAFAMKGEFSTRDRPRILTACRHNSFTGTCW